MLLTTGTKLGAYEILSVLGAGGMGEVYRARDTRLERTVAIKILPAQLSSDPLRKQRFEREAKTISGLNHPHICVLHDVGSQDGIDFLVMECLEGETLAKRLENGPLSLDQFLKFGAQIADALDKAHRNGVVHRDLKPSNIMLTPTGAKLFDFGLAKPSPPLAGLATLTATPMKSPVTEQGSIVGTYQYMSPEQIEGKELDNRSDIFSLGAVLYEMLAGKRAFEGKSQLSVASAILEKDPAPVSSIKPMTPPALDHAVRRCLEKDPEDRWQTARDLALELRWIGEAGSQKSAPFPTGARAMTQVRLAWLLAAVCALAAIVFAGVSLHYVPQRSPMFRSYILPPEKTVFVTMTNEIAGPPVLSPDGSKLTFVARDAQGKSILYVQALNSPTAQALAGTEGATYPFWSADSRSIGFFAEGGRLKRIDASGGPSQTVCENLPLNTRGGTWNATGTILFGFGAGDVPLQRVFAAGGIRTAVAELEDQEYSQRWPQFLPDGKHFLFFVNSAKPEATGIYVGSLDSMNRKLVLRTDTNAQYVPPGYILFVRDQSLMAQPFNERRLETTGDAAPIAENLSVNLGTHRAVFSASDNGVLVFQAGASYAGWQLVWFDREGKRLEAVGEVGQYLHPAISPDGTRVATAIASGKGTDVWIFDLHRATKTRLTFEGTINARPLWTPDGKKIIFISNRKGPWHIYAKPADNSGPEEPVLPDSPYSQLAYSISHDGRYIAFVQDNHIWALPLFGERKPFAVTTGDSRIGETEPAISPDGKWVAYTGPQTGRWEIFVTSFPNAGAKSQVSSMGAYDSQWRSDGKELYFMGQDQRLMAVDVNTRGGSIEFGTPHALFQASPSTRQNGPYAASDGKRFLINATAQEGREPLTLVTNWLELLKK